jgi:hypothetical protein
MLETFARFQPFGRKEISQHMIGIDFRQRVNNARVPVRLSLDSK